MQKHQEVERSRKEIMINNFLGGISWALGTTVGLTVVVAVLGFALQQVGFVPIIGQFVIQITDFVAANSRIL